MNDKQTTAIVDLFSRIRNLNQFNIEQINYDFYIAETDYCIFDFDLFPQLYNNYFKPESNFSLLLLCYYYDSTIDKFILHNQFKISSEQDLKPISEYISDYSKLHYNSLITRFIAISTCNNFYAISDDCNSCTIFLFNDKFIAELLNKDFIKEAHFFCYLVNSKRPLLY